MDSAGLQESLKSRLIATGEYEKLLLKLSERLKDSNWQQGVSAEASQIAVTGGGLEQMGGLEGSALESVPIEVRAEIEGLIQKFVERNVEP